jgi:hypothetical protein
MYAQNKYTDCYYRIIARAKERVNTTYTEKHHIIPKSMGGSNSKDNLVDLTGKEHFVCHLLLVKMTTGNDKKKMLHAVWSFIRSSKNQQREKITGKRYERIRKEFSAMLSVTRKGIMNVGTIASAETRKKLSDVHKGKAKSDITKQRMQLAWKTRSKNTKDTTRELLSVAGHNRWKDTNARDKQSITRKQYLINNPDAISILASNLNKTRFTCTHCGKETNKGNYVRWHGDKCGKNENILDGE